ncbi:hypothetical protein ACFO4N_02220 [Camelliibacillus cellulosilyticus]|uniref:YhcN/YlaJ family sporulation lipoprotein n=1 Tax=Camelliibacillus cellulosilyticus TaxID=2174486 RepID=A0ABV9GHD5_9BACL
MKSRWKSVLIIPVLGALLALSGCSGHGGLLQNGQKSHAAQDQNMKMIPSQNGPKRHTTNKYGTTSSGMGSDVYTRIGSSSIHEGGISSYFESRLKGYGITGVKVFIIDDTVILARMKPEVTSTDYDDLQKHVLSGTSGMSGKGNQNGTTGGKGASHDNLIKAKEKINKMFNNRVKILSVTDPKALDLVDKITKNLESGAYKAVSSDVLTLLQMASSQ